MHSYTQRPAVEWTLSDSSYQKGTVKRETVAYASQYKFQTYLGRTAQVKNGHTRKTIYSYIDEETTFQDLIVYNEDASGSGQENFTPPTYQTTILHVTHSNSTRPSSQSVETATVTRDIEDKYQLDKNFTTEVRITAADTYGSSHKGTSGSSGEKGYSGSVTWDIKSPEPHVTNDTNLSKKVNTKRGTSSHTFGTPQTAYYKEYTTTYSGGQSSIYHTLTYSLATTHTSMPTSSWQIGVSYQTGQHFTGTSSDYEDTNAVTYNGVLRETYTEMSGTSVVQQNSWVSTAHRFGNLEDTVVLMKADRGTDFNLGEMLWVFSLTNLDISATTTGRFTDLFSSVSSDDIIIKEYSKFLTISSSVNCIAISVGSMEMVDSMASDDRTYIATRTSYDGIYYPSSTTSSAYVTATNGATATRKSLVEPNFSTTSKLVFQLPGVSSSVSTFYTETAHTTPASSITVYFHTVAVSSYRSSDSSWETTSRTQSWVSAGELNFAYDKRLKAVSKTHLVSYRATTADEILVSKFHATGTHAVFIGLQKETSMRVLTKQSTQTVSSYYGGLHSYETKYTSIENTGDGSATASEGPIGGSADTGSGSDSGGDATNRGGYTLVYADEVNVTKYTEQRLTPLIERVAIDLNLEILNRVVYRAHPVGWAGFGGSFQGSGLQIWETTTQGLASGSTFGTWQSINLDFMAYAANDLLIGPAVNSPYGVGGQSSSVLSPPAGLQAMMSVAATWVATTSTTQSGGDTTSTFTSRFATHTLRAINPITGVFWTAEALQIDNYYRMLNGEGTAFEGSVGFGLGENVLRESYQVILDAGYVEWTEYASGQSSPANGQSSVGTNGSVSFGVPWSHAIVFRAENIFSARWANGNRINHFSSTPYTPTD
jgi:hypothetical protein